MTGYATIFTLVVVFLPWFQIEDSSFHWTSILGYYSTAVLLVTTGVDDGGPDAASGPRCTASAISPTGCFPSCFFSRRSPAFWSTCFRLMNLAMATYVTYVVHLAIAVPMLVVEVPFGKWSHLLYRPLAIFVAAVKKRGPGIGGRRRRPSPAQPWRVMVKHRIAKEDQGFAAAAV